MLDARCRQLRKDKGYTQEKLAEICQVSRQTVSKWEAGTMLPEMDKLLILSDVFGVSLDHLIKGDQEDHVDPNPVISFEKICELLLPRRNEMEVLYRDAELYDIIHDERRHSNILELWRRLDLGQYGISTIHDCSIGTGQMTIQLATLGFRVSGSDISPDMLEKCRTNCDHYGVDIPVTQCDFRFLSKHVEGTYDCVMSTGNSLGHVENRDVAATLREMDRLVRDEGYIFFDIRNWDLILKNHQRFYFYNPFYPDGKRVNLMQVWDYNLDGTITFNLIHTFEENDRLVDTKVSSVYYYPVSRKFLLDCLKDMGYSIVWEKPFPDCDEPVETSDWYQILARKGKR